MTRFEPALFVLGGLIVVGVALMTPWEVPWRRVTSRIAVEVVRLRTRRAGKHTETRRQTAARDDAWAIQLHDIAADLDPLPLYDEGIAIREQYRREAWAATGMTQAEYWRSQPTPNQAMNLWRANDVIPPRIAATLARAQADQTVIDSDLTPETRAALVEQFAGGDVYDGEGERWFDAFDRIEARAHEAIAKARADIEHLFMVGAR